MRFSPPSIAARGKLAQAVAAVHQHQQKDCDVTGRIQCPRCGAAIQFTIQRDGHSRGRCVASGCLSWCH